MIDVKVDYLPDGVKIRVRTHQEEVSRLLSDLNKLVQLTGCENRPERVVKAPNGTHVRVARQANADGSEETIDLTVLYGHDSNAATDLAGRLEDALRRK